MRLSKPLFELWRLNKYTAPQNAHTAHTIRFCPTFRQLTLIWTAYQPMSEGVERFVDEFLPIIRENNPHIHYRLDRSLVKCDPWVVGYYEWERVRKRRACWFHECQVLAQVEQMSVGGDFRPGLKRGVRTRIPRRFQLWDIETKGHDIFEVYSKWKADPRDPNRVTSMTHPYLIYKRQMPKKVQDASKKLQPLVFSLPMEEEGQVQEQDVEKGK